MRCYSTLPASGCGGQISRNRSEQKRGGHYDSHGDKYWQMLKSSYAGTVKKRRLIRQMCRI